MWKSFLILTLIEFCSCAALNPAPPDIPLTIWAGTPERAEIGRGQAGAHIKCEDPLFAQYACVSYDDLKRLYMVIQSCKEWP